MSCLRLECLVSDIECPYCKHEYEDDGGETSRAASEVANSTVDKECPECEKTFEVFVEWDPCYYSNKKA